MGKGRPECWHELRSGGFWTYLEVLRGFQRSLEGSGGIWKVLVRLQGSGGRTPSFP